MADSMKFPDTFDEFAEQYNIIDKEEVYTNGTELIPIFRVKQWLERKADVAEARWIDVNDRLPKDYANCLVHYKHAYNTEDGYWAIGISYYNGEKFLIDWVYQVTHWMPLPEPPTKKGVKSDGKVY